MLYLLWYSQHFLLIVHISVIKDFLNDIDLIAENATAYNCDLAFETNRIICHRYKYALLIVIKLYQMYII